jgi:hypothetical protein
MAKTKTNKGLKGLQAPLGVTTAAEPALIERAGKGVMPIPEVEAGSKRCSTVASYVWLFRSAEGRIRVRYRNSDMGDRSADSLSLYLSRS